MLNVWFCFQTQSAVSKVKELMQHKPDTVTLLVFRPKKYICASGKLKENYPTHIWLSYAGHKDVFPF